MANFPPHRQTNFPRQGRQRFGGRTHLPLVPLGDVRKIGHLTSRQLHDEVEGARKAPYLFVVNSVQPSEEPFQYRG